MEEFQHMVEDEFKEEEFYETIEAPKFVDLTAPDHRPEGDDRYWFCSRVGCDQKHEEFMDSEAIYKQFVLRVMAARSPSVRLRKALYPKDSSVVPKCPNTVPAKPSRSRVSRLAMISSIPQRANGEIKSKDVKVVSTIHKNATPKVNKSRVISSAPKKALTERKKQMQSPAGFRSVQNPRTAMKQSEKRVVAKALVFGSPKKVVKLKRSVELRSSVKKLCNGMRKLEIENKRNGLGVNHKVVTPSPSNRPLRRREVKSLVFDSLRSQKPIIEKSKEKVKGKRKEEPLVSSDPSKANGMETEDKENALALECENKENASNAADDSAVTNDIGVDKAKKDEAIDIGDKENATNAADVDKESDDKENSSALDNNRKVENTASPLLKKKVFSKKDNFKTTQKVMTTADKCFNGKTNAHVKYTKPKLTSPKPFRLRTDERRILKEANMEKKPQCDLLTEKEDSTNILGFHGENSNPKHQSARMEKDTTSRSKAFKGISTALYRHNASQVISNSKRVVKKQVASKRTETMEEEKTTLMNGESKEVFETINNNNKPSVCAVVASGEKRLAATVPKGPNFHSIHVPKSCTKRMASLQVQ